MAPPPLFGDAEEKYRIHIVGNSASRESPRRPLDTLFWKPGWEQSTTEELQANVPAALANAPNGWVVGGNFANRVGPMLEAVSTDVIWLDTPLALYLPRLIWRTILRLLRPAPPCQSGCNERLTEVLFSKDSIIWWCLSQHWIVRRREGERMQKIGVSFGTDVDGRRMRRLGGWGGELRRWFAEVEKMVQK
ncbi:hypothetical protein FB45DRAFT_839370 [Roridomyces roridus]|uniref:Uncharacterized protein n=1 Tax=Roridomyces roridus TaxID=1738132 RepID=A0AAD7BFT1_9AGAR|nr:hypothetical protein FB45DRAFT_839370 [Roridomyces roridus]